MKRIIVAILLVAAAAGAYAHSGGTDKRGCHTDHRTGVYHCH